MSSKFQEIFVDIVAMFIILSAGYEAVFTDIPISTWATQLSIGVVFLVSPLSKLGTSLLDFLKNKFK